MVYNINGQSIGGDFLNSCQLSTGIHAQTYYYALRIFKKKQDGLMQFPFVIASNGTLPTDKSALDFALSNDYYLVMNSGLGGIFNSGQTTHSPMGVLIQNGVIIQDEQISYRPLWIDGNGDLHTAPADTTAATLISSGAVSALCSFGPIVEDYDAVAQADYPSESNWSAEAQRQIIGQYGNGDYAIITAEGRDFDNSKGWTIPEAQALCQALNLKFAYNLDGGGSTETVLGKKQLNTIYERTTGRRVCSFIVFNGTDTYVAPAN